MWRTKKKEQQVAAAAAVAEVASPEPSAPISLKVADRTRTGVNQAQSQARGGGQAPSATEFAQLSSLLQQKCDENDDLHHNLRLAKDSLRHLSEELDQSSATAEQLREENQRLQQDKTVLEEEVATLRAAIQSKDTVSAELQRRMESFQAVLETREAALREEVQHLNSALQANQIELEHRDRRIARLAYSVDDMQEGVAVGRVHIKKLTALLSKSSLAKSPLHSTSREKSSPVA
jgi:chromosome segregation ATPase